MSSAARREPRRACAVSRSPMWGQTTTPPSCAERDRGLQVTAEARTPADRPSTGNGRGRIAARPAQHQRPAADDPHHRVLRRPDNRPVVDEEQVGDLDQPLHGLALVDGDGLFAEVAAGRHDRKAQRAHQQMMQRRIGQHRAEQRIAGRHASATRRTAPPQQHDRPLGTCQQGSFLGRNRAARVRRPQASGTSPRRACPAGACASRKPPHGRLVRASTSRWKPPTPLTATISPRSNRRRRET